MRVFSKEHREKLRKAQIKLWKDPEYRASTLKLFSLGQKGLKKSAETKQKISVSQIGISKPNSGVRGEKHYRWNPNKSLFGEYRREVQRLTEKNYRDNRDIINPQGFQRSKSGVPGGHQLDHKISVKEGFEKGLPAHEIASVNNLQMLSWKENRSKGA